jgi:hypothetical protein
LARWGETDVQRVSNIWVGVAEYYIDSENRKIDDDGLVHYLRLLKDRESGCIRLAAARVEGAYDVTLWTAFITSQICTSDWMYYVRPNTVVIKNIRQFSFSACFATNMFRELELKFRVPGDAKDFGSVINGEARKIAERQGNVRRSPPGTHRNSYF